MELTDPIKAHVEDKIGSLKKYISRYDEGDSVIVDVEVGRRNKHHKKGEVFRAEANLDLPGKMLRAEERDYDIYIAVNKVRGKIQREINKYKTERGDK